MPRNGSRRFPARRASAVIAAAMTSLALAALPQSASAATQTYTVDSTVHSNVASATADANPADGVCATAAGTCTLRAAIEQANALPASPGDDVRIAFSSSLVSSSAKITLPSNGLRMQTTGASHNGISNDYLGSGFFYVVDAQRPVAIDLGGAVSIESSNDAGNGIFLVKSTGVTIENFKNLRGGDSSIVIDRPARSTTIRNGACLDPDTIILETCVGLISGTRDIAISDLTIESSYRFGIFADRAKAGDDPITNVAITGLKSTGTQQYGDIWFEIDAKVDGFTVDDAELNSPSGYAFGLQSGSEVKDLKITNSKFLGANAFQIFTYSNSTTENLTVEDSTFDGTRWAFVDHGRSTHRGLTLRGNTFTDIYQHVLDLVDSKLENAVIENNDFVDARGNGLATIWIGQPGTSNVIRGNTFTQAEDVFNNRWAIYNNAVPPTANDDSGWAFRDNHVDGYRSVSGGPIVNVGRGKVEMVRNTFGPRTNGTIIPVESEVRSSNRFVSNRETDINKSIQTWRPTAASADGTNLTIRVAPVTPTLGGNTDPTGPVDVDVFWTADDHAEVYVGRITGAIAGDDYVLPTDKVNGRFRVQTIDANGNHSQYSAPMQVGAPTQAAPPTIVGVDGSDDLFGTGEPGAQVTVTAAGGATYGPVTVGPDGNWTIPGGFATCLKLTAVQTNDSGVPSAPSPAFSTPACISAPVIDAIDTDGNADGTGEPGAAITLRDGNGVVVGTSTVGDDGKWTVAGPLPCGTTLVAIQEKSGHTSGVSNALPTPDCIAAPTILEITENGDLAGDGLPNATVRVYDEDGELVGETTADADGNWKLDGPLPCGKTLVARQTEGGGFSPNSTPVETGACPTAPTITAIDGDGNLDGTGQPGATVTVRDQDGRVVGTAKVRPNGTWDVSGPLPCGSTLTATQQNADGNVSPVSGSLETPACPTAPLPAAPTVTSAVDADGKARGTGEPGATVKVYDADGSLIGEAVVRADGRWTVAGPVPCGTTLTARQTDASGAVSAFSDPVATAACVILAPPVIVPPVVDVLRPTSEDAIRLQCGTIPLQLIDVRRGAKSKRTKRYGQTTVTGVADRKYAGQTVTIRFLGTNKVAGTATVGTDGRFSLRVKDGDPKNRLAANKRRYRAEIGGARSVALKLTRRFDVTSVTAAGASWKVRAKASGPVKKGALVRVRVLDGCGDGQSWKQVATARLSAKGTVTVSIAAPSAGGFQLVRLDTAVPLRKGGKTSKTFTVPRGLR